MPLLPEERALSISTSQENLQTQPEKTHQVDLVADLSDEEEYTMCHIGS